MMGCPTSSGDDDGAETSASTGDEVCDRYVACVGEVKPADQGDASARLGEGGTCWDDAIDAQMACIDECVSGLGEAHLDSPAVAACEPPKTLNDAIFEIGAAVFDPNDPFADPMWGPLQDGDPLEMVLGGQGLLMFPIALRGANFEIAADPTDFDDPKMPRVDMWMDIEGYNTGVADHFTRLYNYPISFKPLTDEVVEFLYIALIVPDEISDPYVLDGLPGHIWIELQPYQKSPIVRELDVEIVVDQLTL
ncbi:MAG: hypothetical protein H6710_14355 [Myxococcales bacterium]|nr:hypothetical protein [Myxococcales bacterium]